MTPQWHIMQAHPLAWTELFNPESNKFDCPSCHPSVLLGNTHQNEFNVTSLAKMFMFGSFVKARAEAESMSLRNIVDQEIEQYPYTRRSTYHVPFFTPLDMFNKDEEFNAAVTDAGACQVNYLCSIPNIRIKLKQI